MAAAPCPVRGEGAFPCAEIAVHTHFPISTYRQLLYTQIQLLPVSNEKMSHKYPFVPSPPNKKAFVPTIVSEWPVLTLNKSKRKCIPFFFKPARAEGFVPVVRGLDHDNNAKIKTIKFQSFFAIFFFLTYSHSN